MDQRNEKFVILAEIFQNGMVLQREKPILLWGHSQKPQYLSVSINHNSVFAGDIPEGDFSVELPAQEATENILVRVENQYGEYLELRDVDIGEVWIAGGQSNMEFPLICDWNGENTIAKANDPHLRYFEVGRYAFEGEREEKLKADHRWNHWRKFLPEECTHFSAVGSYFAQQLRKTLNVPVAIVCCCWGGTSASAWMDEAILRADPQLSVYTDAYDKVVSGMDLEKYRINNYRTRKMIGSERNTASSERSLKNEIKKPTGFVLRQILKLFANVQNVGPHSENRPGGLYQTMLQTIAGFTARGVIWYQGESDEHHASLYGKLFTEMIQCWRRDWKDDLPFLFVQLAPWEEWMTLLGTNYPKVRAEQQYVEDHVPRTYMASIMDIGSQYDIHPKKKAPVGERLALLALDKIYAISQAYAHAPRICAIQRYGRKIIVTFDYADDGMIVNGTIDNLFRVVQKGQLLPIDCKVDGNNVIVHCDALTEATAELSFAYQPYLEMNLFNLGGLPARPLAPCEI